MTMDEKEKAKAYDEALERAKAILNVAADRNETQGYVSTIFPELSKSEDERIREAIKYCIKQGFIGCGKIDNVTPDECLAWLEKQGGNLVKNGYTNNKDVIKYADNYSHEIWHKLMDNFKNIKDYHIGCNDVSDIVLNAIIDTCNCLEKQGASIDVDSILNKVGIKRAYKDGDAWCILYGDNIQDGVCGFGYTKEEALIEFLKELLEKQGEEQPISDTSVLDIVKPKFNIGDWVVTDKNNVVQIKAIENDKYVLENTMSFSVDYVDKCWRKWSISDAKDGDVLAVEDKRDHSYTIFITHGSNDITHAYVSFDTSFRKLHIDDKDHQGLSFYDSYKPATKEQRDLLFQKMQEAGYMWNSEKMELVKIEQKPAWSEKDEKMLNFCIKHYADGNCITWLKSLKQRLEGK